MAASDKAKENAQFRANLRKEYVGAMSDAQVKIARERARQRRANTKLKTNQVIRERQESEAARVAAAREKAAINVEQMQARQRQRVEATSDIAGIQRRERAITGAQRSVTGSDVWSTIVLIVGLFFGMIILYVLVTNGSQFGKLAGTAGIWIRGLSSNQPLFVRKS